MSKRNGCQNIPGGKVRSARKFDNFTAFCEPIVKKMWDPRHFTTVRVFIAYYNNGFTSYG
jgi:hypothetical protein